MDFYHRIHQLLAQLRIHARISALSTESIQRFWLTRYPWLSQNWKRVAGAGALVSCLGFGVWAHDLTLTEAFRKWEKSHLPSDRVLEYAIKSRGYQKISDPVVSERMTRWLIVPLDQSGMIWVSRDRKWVVHSSQIPTQFDLHLYCLECKGVQRDWESLGFGYRAMDQMIEILDQYLRSIPRKGLKSRPQEYRDPREIRF